MVNEETVVINKTFVPGGVSNPRPEFLRLPKSGERCPYTSMSRTGLNLLILPCAANNFCPPVRSISLRKRGQVKATRLIVFDSLMAYLYGLENQNLPVSATPSSPTASEHISNSPDRGSADSCSGANPTSA